MILICADDVKDINKEFNNAKEPWVDESLLNSAFSAYTYYETETEQICSIFRGLIKNHPFSDGNKRTAAAVLITYFEQYRWGMSNEDLCELTLDVATHNYDVSEITQKVESFVKPTI